MTRGGCTSRSRNPPAARSSSLARALSEEAERSLQAVDLLLTDTAIWYRDEGARQTGADIENALRMRASATPQVSVLTITDADGRQLYRSRQTGEPLADVSDRPTSRRNATRAWPACSSIRRS